MNASTTTTTIASTTTTIAAVWFSRHQPTPEQVEDAAARGFHIAAITEGMALGARSLESDDDVVAALRDLFDLATEHGARAVFGVFATPMLAEMAETAQQAVNRGDWSPRFLACWASWNVARTPEGGRPTFAHKEWKWVGQVGCR